MTSIGLASVGVVEISVVTDRFAVHTCSGTRVPSLDDDTLVSCASVCVCVYMHLCRELVCVFFVSAKIEGS